MWDCRLGHAPLVAGSSCTGALVSVAYLGYRYRKSLEEHRSELKHLLYGVEVLSMRMDNGGSFHTP